MGVKKKYFFPYTQCTVTPLLTGHFLNEQQRCPVLPWEKLAKYLKLLRKNTFFLNTVLK